MRRTRLTRPESELIVLDSLTYAGRISNLSGLDQEIEFVKGDIRDSRLVDRLVSSVDLVVHFAAESHNDNSLDNPRPFLETNIIGTFEIIQSCVKHSTRVHHVSTDEVFGDLPIDGKEKFTTETAYNPSSPYSATKAASDMMVRAWVRSFDLQATISNCSNNYGPFQHEEKFIPRTILLAANGVRPKIYGNGLNIRDWIHVDDHSDGIWAVLEHGQIGQTYLLGADGERSNLEVAQSVLRIMGLAPDFIDFIPDRPGHDARYALDTSRTSSELGWKPSSVSFEEGLVDVVRHYVALAESGQLEAPGISKLGLSTPKGGRTFE